MKEGCNICSRVMVKANIIIVNPKFWVLGLGTYLKDNPYQDLVILFVIWLLILLFSLFYITICLVFVHVHVHVCFLCIVFSDNDIMIICYCIIFLVDSVIVIIVVLYCIWC